MGLDEKSLKNTDLYESTGLKNYDFMLAPLALVEPGTNEWPAVPDSALDFFFQVFEGFRRLFEVFRLKSKFCAQNKRGSAK